MITVDPQMEPHDCDDRYRESDPEGVWCSVCRTEGGGVASTRNAHEAAAETSYVRTRNGQMVHRASCAIVRRVAFPKAWTWAEGKDPYQLLSELGGHGIRYDFCSRCIPEVAP